MTTRWRPNLDELPIDKALTLIVVRKRGNGVDGRKVRTATPVTRVLRQACHNTANMLRGFDAISYGPDALIEDEEYMAVPAEVVENESRQVMALLRRATALDTLDPREIPKRLWFYAAVVGANPGDRVAFVRKVNPHLIAKPGAVIATLGETLSKVDEPVFVLEAQFDLVVFTGGVAVLNATPFETLFRGAPELGERIPIWAKAISDQLPVAAGGTDRLIDAGRRNSRLARRLRSIYEQGHLADVTIEKLRSVARDQGLDERTLFEGDELVINENTDTTTLLRFLNDDLFTGGLSGRRFTADRKRTR
jgi:hypothetical protein